MVVFAHNVHVRFKTLDDTIGNEKISFPDSHSIIAYNVQDPIPFLRNYVNMKSLHFPGQSHKIGCTNGCMAAIKEALKIDGVEVIIFSHDDVMVMNPDIVEANINLIKSGEFDVICRKPLPEDRYGKDYYMMEVFYLSKKAAEVIFQGLEYYQSEFDIPKDARGSISPEVFLYQVINDKGLKILEKGYDHKLEGYNDTLIEAMGYYHKNIGERGWVD